MGIRFRIILIIIIVMSMISLSVYFLGDNVNTRIFRNIINENINNKFTVIANEFENNIITAREEVEKLSFSLSAMYNNLNNRSREYLYSYLPNFLSSSVNNLNYEREISILFFQPLAGTYRYSPADNEFVITERNNILNIRNFKSSRIYMNYDSENNLVFNIDRAINNVNNNAVIGIVGISIPLSYNSENIKNIFAIKESDILIINKNDLSIINSKEDALNNLKIDALYPDDYELLNSNTENNNILNSDIIVNNLKFTAYVKTISKDLNMVMFIPETYYNSEMKEMNKSTVYMVIVAFFVAMMIIVFLIKLVFNSVTRVTDTIGNSIDDNDLRLAIPEVSGSDEIAEMAKWIEVINNGFQHTLSNIKKNVAIFKRQTSAFPEKISENVNTIYSVNESVENIRKNLNEESNQIDIAENNNKNIQEYIESNTSNINAININAKNLQDKILEESASIEKTVSSIEDMIKNIENIDSIIESAENKTRNLLSASSKSKEKIKSATKSTEDLISSLVAISNFVSSIRNIARQTNLLAMNAAIEAAHAGKYSTGFAVVAEEIRILSETSDEQADNADRILQEIKDRISTTSYDLSDSAEQFSTLIKDVSEITDLMDSVHNSSSGQSKITNEILHSITMMSKLSENIKSQYINITERLGEIKNNIESLSSLSLNNSKALSSIRNVSGNINENIEKISVNSGNLYASVNNRGMNLILLKEFVKNKFGEDGYQKWITAMQPSSSLIFKNDILSNDWYPYMTAFHNPYRLVCDLFYDGSNTGIKEIAEYSYNRILPKWTKIFSIFIPKFFILSYGTEFIFKNLFDPVSIEIIKSRKGVLIAHIKDFNEDSDVLELSILYWASSLLESINNVKSSIEITKSMKEGNAYTELLLKW